MSEEEMIPGTDSVDGINGIKKPKSGYVLSDEELRLRFMYHSPLEGQAAKYSSIRAEALMFARLIDEACPDSREKSLSLTKLDEVVMWANAGIARRECAL